MSVELADLELAADLGDRHVDPCQRNRLAEFRRAGAAGHHTDFGAAEIDVVAMADRVLGVDLEPDQL